MIERIGVVANGFAVGHDLPLRKSTQRFKGTKGQRKALGFSVAPLNLRPFEPLC